MRTGLVWGAVAALGLSVPAFAQDGFSYSYVDVGYVSTSIDDSDLDSDGIGISGAVELNDRVHLIAGYSNEDFDIGNGVNLDAKAYEIGAGINWPLNRKLDIESHLSYVHAKVGAANFGSVDDDGVKVGLDLRGRVGNRWELRGGVNYEDYDTSDGDASTNFGARYFFTEQFAIGADLNLYEDGSTVFLGGRFNFGK